MLPKIDFGKFGIELLKPEPKIIYTDSQIVICDKPAKLSVTRSQSEKLATLQDFLEEKFNLKIAGRAGLVHRLDKDTSGLIIAAKTQKSFEILQKQFKEQKVIKKYIALVHQIPKVPKFNISLPIARHKFGRFATKAYGRTSQTTFSVLKKYEFGSNFQTILEKFPKSQHRYFEKNCQFYALCEVTPKTGRTHQIRVHAKAAGYPIVADPLYLPRKLRKFDEFFCPRLFLHAVKIEFVHPQTNQLVAFETRLPTDLTAALLYLKEIRVN